MKPTFQKITMPIIDSNKIKQTLWTLGKNAFSIILLLILLDLIIGVGIFYGYVIIAKVDQPETTGGAFKFEYTKYQKVLHAWQEKEQYFTELSNQNHSNLFK